MIAKFSNLLRCLSNSSYYQVSYDTTGFLEKNRDPLHHDSVELLSSCSCQLSKLFASRILDHPLRLASPSQSGGLDSQKQSVATKFKVTEIDKDTYLSTIVSSRLPFGKANTI